MHGYALVQRIEAESTGRVRLFPGNLYSVLRRLLDSGMVRETELRPPPQNDDSRRRYYELTGEGRLVLANEARRMEHLVDLVRARRVLEVATDE